MKTKLLLVLFLVFLFEMAPVKPLRSATLGDDEQLLRVGVGAYRDGLYEVAENHLTNFIKNYPNDKRVHDASYLLGKTLWSQGKWKEAKTTFSRIVVENPKFDTMDYVLFWMADIEMRSGSAAEARKVLLSLVRGFPKFEGIDYAYFALGLLDLEGNNLVTGESFFRKAAEVSKRPTLVQSSVFWLGVSAYRRNDLDSAVTYFQTFLKKAPGGPPEYFKYALLWLGDAQVKLGRFEEARKEYQRYAERYPGDALLPEVSWRLGFCEYRLGHAQVASDILQPLKGQFKESKFLLYTHYLLGQTFLLQGQYAASLKELNPILENPAGMALWGVVLLAQYWDHIQLGMQEEANRVFQKLIKLNYFAEEHHLVQRLHAELLFLRGRIADSLPYYFNILNSPFRERALFQIGKGYFFENKFREAVTNLDLMLLEFPNSPYFEEGLFIKGEALLRLGDYPQALETYRLISGQKKADGWKPMALIQVGMVHLIQNEGEKAEKAFRSVMETFPHHPLFYDAAYQLGDLEMMKKNIREAIRYYSIVLEGNIADWVGETYFRLGEIFYERENYEKAFASFETALTYLDESSPWFFLAQLEMGNLQRRWERYEDARKAYRTILDRAKDEDIRNAAKELLEGMNSQGKDQPALTSGRSAAP
jgi:TolA-binding protein